MKVIGTRGAGMGEFNKPRSVAVDAQDNARIMSGVEAVLASGVLPAADTVPLYISLGKMQFNAKGETSKWFNQVGYRAARLVAMMRGADLYGLPQ